MATRAAGLRGTREDFRALAQGWARDSCAAQGLAVKITDRRVLDAVSLLLVESRELRE